MVVVQKSLKIEQVIVLEDSDGEFLQCEPTYKDPPRRVCLVEDPQVIDENSWRPLNKHSQQREAKTWEQEQTISELQESLIRSTATAARHRKKWKIYCEHLAEQDAIIAAHEEEITTLEQIRELQARVRSPGFPPPEEHRPSVETRSRTIGSSSGGGPHEDVMKVDSSLLSIHTRIRNRVR